MSHHFSNGQQKWLHVGLSLLGDLGADAVTIDILCKRLKLSKGSFYHHFMSRKDFLHQLTLFWEKTMTERVIEIVESEKGDFLQKLYRLGELTSSTTFQPIERAMRHWATQNAQTKLVWQRVEQRRLTYTEKLLNEAQLENPRLKARALHAIFIGTQYLCPPASREEIFEMYLEIIPFNTTKIK